MGTNQNKLNIKMDSLKKYTLTAGILILLSIGSIQEVTAQINLGGQAYYQVDVVGYMGRGVRGCGGVDGLHRIIAINSSNNVIHDRRMIHEPFHVNYVNNKNNPVTAVEIHKVIRYKNGIGDCAVGPYDRVIDDMDYIDHCFSEFRENGGDGLVQLTVTNRPVVALNEIVGEAILGNQDVLRIVLPDNLQNSHYNWMYQVGTGPERRFPASYNGGPVLELLGEDFLSEADFGKNISVWLEMNCDAGERLAEGIARRNTYEEGLAICNELPYFQFGNPGTFPRQDCIDDLNNYVDENYSDHLTPELIAQYQSRVSNVIQFQYLKTAPKLIAEPTEVSCYDSQDGQIRITFDRPLETNESLDISLVDLSRREGEDDTNGRPRYAVVKTYNNISDFDDSNSILFDDLPPSTSAGFRIDLVGSGGSVPLYTGGINHTAIVNVNRPIPVSFQITDVINVWCNDGDTDPTNNNDGEIHLRADGGNPGRYEFSITGENQTGTWQNFSESKTHHITGLRPGNYNIRVRKWIPTREVYCDAKEQGVGEEIVLEQEITQPEAPLQLVYVHDVEPTAYGFTNGSITARVYGGTPISGNSYNFEWRNSDGDLMTDTTTRYETGQGYFITLNNIPAGIYFLTVTDSNYNQATFKDGCTIVDSEFTLEQPDPLQVIFEETNSISCNSENTQNDPYSDGEITAHVSGGVQLGLFDNGGLPYYYTWKKWVEGQWVVLEAETDSILSGISHGEYALNVRDANGIILGEYEHNILVRDTDSTVTILQPELLDISHSKNNPTCAQGNNGNATIEVSGGTPPYSVSWSNGASTYSVEDLTNGIYLVYVTDSKGCRAEEEIILEQPDGMQPQVTTSIPPTCYLGNDGIIEVVTSGGTPPFTYVWNTGETTPYISNLEAGTYRVQVTDAKNCVTYIEETLEETPPLVVELGEDRTLCDWQWLELDITIDDPGAVYNWVSDNGFASDSPVVQLTEPGIYTATITTSKGCVGSEEIEVKTSTDPIDAHFVLSTQAFALEETSLVNISSPVGDKVEWTIPEGVDMIYEANNKIIVLFKEAGIYDINLRSYQGDCYMDYTKNIIVEQAVELQDIGDSNNPFIEEFIVYPNPSNGNFKIKLSLAEEANISVKVISLVTSSVMDARMEGGSRDYLLEYNLQHLQSGVYLLLLETPKGDEIRKLVFD